MHQRHPLRPFTVAVAILFSGTAVAQITTRVSVDSNGLPAAGPSFGAAMSADGRFVAYASASSDLVPADTNGVSDVFVHERSNGTTVRASVSTTGAQADADCIGQFLSADGRYVSFRSAATTLVLGDTNSLSDIFVRDLALGTTERVSVATGGGEANGESFYGVLSADGRFVLFTSQASNLVAGDTNEALDVFVHDRATGVTERVSVDSSGTETEFLGYSIAGTISADGRFVTFESPASNLVAGDTNGAVDVFVHDRQNGTTIRASVGAGGIEADGASEFSSISADGRRVAFTSYAENLVPNDTNWVEDVFVRDLVAGTTVRASVGPGGVQANDESYTYYAHTAISHDGRFVTFQAKASNLTAAPDVNGTADVFVHDLVLSRTILASASSAGVRADGESIRPVISSNGRTIAFESVATNLTAGDVNGTRDIFVRDLRTFCLPIEAYCTAKVNSHGCAPAILASGVPSASGQGTLSVVAVDEIAGSHGMYVWSLAPAAVPFGGGTLCLSGPLTRTPVQSATVHPSAVPPGACTGAFRFAFDAAYIQARGLVPGTTVFGQYVSRDGGFAPPDNLALSDAIRFTICP